MNPLPMYVPEVYRLHPRIVDAEGYVNLNRIKYSAPYRLIGRTLEVRETLERVDLYDGPRRVATPARYPRRGRAASVFAGGSHARPSGPKPAYLTATRYRVPPASMV